MALWRSGELGMVQFSWNWNVPVTSDHERMHWKSMGIGLSTEYVSVCVWGGGGIKNYFDENFPCNNYSTKEISMKIIIILLYNEV